MNLKDLKIDSKWTLFLDRDGVINKKLEADYVKVWDEFEFLPEVLETLPKLAEKFGRIIIITNQRGISRSLMTEDDLHKIHALMLDEINKAGGKIDKIYYCPHNRDDGCNCRKPKIGMALQAKKDFPEIDFKKSIMAGDAQSDMDLGKEAGMINVLINTSNLDNKEYFEVKSLKEFAKSI